MLRNLPLITWILGCSLVWEHEGQAKKVIRKNCLYCRWVYTGSGLCREAALVLMLKIWAHLAVIDGLDECQNMNVQRYIVRILSTEFNLFTSNCHFSSLSRLVSRPEALIYPRHHYPSFPSPHLLQLVQFALDDWYDYFRWILYVRHRNTVISVVT